MHTPPPPPPPPPPRLLFPQLLSSPPKVSPTPFSFYFTFFSSTDVRVPCLPLSHDHLSILSSPSTTVKPLFFGPTLSHTCPISNACSHSCGVRRWERERDRERATGKFKKRKVKFSISPTPLTHAKQASKCDLCACPYFSPLG